MADQAWLDAADENSAALSYLPFAFDAKAAAPPAAPKKKKGRAEGKGKVEIDVEAIKRENAEYIDYFGGPLAGKHAIKPASSEKFYLTTAINYTNGNPHMGHAYEALTSDVICRYHRGYGRDVFFMTGTDEHGQKIAESAAKEGLTPIQLCDKYVAGFKSLNTRMQISNNFYVRTTLQKHEDFARWMWKKAYDAGDIYLDTYEGWYNVKEEAFVPDNEAEMADFKDAAGNPLQRMKEQSLFFRMSKYQERLVKHIADNPSFIEPEGRRKEIVARLQEPLRDLSCSRTTFDWGVAIPELGEKYEKKHVMYVWFDALSNYLSGIDYETGKGNALYWNGLNGPGGRATHVIGKDITWFHCVIWPTMLMSCEIPLPTQIYAHGFVQDREGKKMSKSIGNVIDPNEMLDRFPLDTFRYYTVSQTPYGADLPFSAEAMQLLHNSELADTLGNLVHRAVSICQKYCPGADGGEVPDVPSDNVFDIAKLREETDAAMNKSQIEVACFKAMDAVRETNGYLTKKEPWKMKFKEGEDDTPRKVVVRSALEAIYVLASFLAPYIPRAASGVYWKLNTAPVCLQNLSPKFDNLKPGTKVRVGQILFQKLETEEEKAKMAADAAAKKKAKEEAAKAKKGGGGKKGKGGAADPNQPEITKLELRVGHIVKVWEHPDAEKLWCEEIDVGEDAPRKIASGLRDHYTQEQMMGRKVIVVANLKARKLQGFASAGMVLCAKEKTDGGEKVEFVDPPAGAKVGEKITFEGLAGDPVTPAQVDKKKVFQKAAPDMKSSDAKVASWKGVPFMTSAGPCTVPSLKNALIS